MCNASAKLSVVVAVVIVVVVIVVVVVVVVVVLLEMGVSDASEICNAFENVDRGIRTRDRRLRDEVGTTLPKQVLLGDLLGSPWPKKHKICCASCWAIPVRQAPAQRKRNGNVDGNVPETLRKRNGNANGDVMET